MTAAEPAVPAVALTRTGLMVGGESRRLLSAEVHSWRLDPRVWPKVLDGVRSLGFTTVATYVPWSAHEIEPGHYDFTASLDIAAFCHLAQQKKLGVILRVGPDAGAELPGSGWPKRILDDPRCQARRPSGQPYLLISATGHCFPPSYASEQTLAEVAGWYDEIAPRVAALQAPDGPVAAVQVDNEMGYHFQSHAFALDHHPDAIDGFRASLSRRYGTISELNVAYGTRYPDLDAVGAPRDGDDGPERWRLDWVTWKEEHLRVTLTRLATMLRERGIDRVPLLHNHHPRTETPMDLHSLEHSAVDVCAADIYVTKEGGRFVSDLARFLAGSSRLPFVAELGAGWLALPWLLPMAMTPLDEEVLALRALLGGVRAANVYMLVERDRWFASPIDRWGEVRPERAALWPRLHHLLDSMDLDSLHRDAPVLVVENRIEGRREAAGDLLGEVVPCFSQVVPLDPRLARLPSERAKATAAWEAGVIAGLTERGIEFDRTTSGALNCLPMGLDHYELIVLSCFDAVDPTALAALGIAADSGIQVVLGPRAPELDDQLQPLSWQAGGVQVEADPSSVAKRLPPCPVRCEHPDIDIVRWTGEGREVVVAFNASGHQIVTTLKTGGPAKLSGRWIDEELEEADGEVKLTIGPWATQAWEVERP